MSDSQNKPSNLSPEDIMAKLELVTPQNESRAFIMRSGIVTLITVGLSIASFFGFFASGVQVGQAMEQIQPTITPLPLEMTVAVAQRETAVFGTAIALNVVTIVPTFDPALPSPTPTLSPTPNPTSVIFEPIPVEDFPYEAVVILFLSILASLLVIASLVSRGLIAQASIITYKQLENNYLTVSKTLNALMNQDDDDTDST